MFRGIDPAEPADRVLVLAPLGRDADLTAGALARVGIEAAICRDLDDLCDRLDERTGAILTTEEAVAHPQVERLIRALDQQPPWSDLPIVVFTAERDGRRAAAADDRLSRLGNVTLLDRPVRVRTMVAAVRAALRARRRQLEARQAIRERDRFLAMLGHELRNPLAAIQLAVDVVRKAPPEHASSARSFGVIDRQARQLKRLVDDLLDVARVTSGKVALQCARVDVGAIVRECVLAESARAEASRVRLSLDEPREALVVHGDPARLSQVFQNLVSNALKYTRPGGEVVVRARRAGEQVVVDVRDTGVGIAPDALSRIFDLFTQVDSSLARSQGGLGIGLTLVRSLVRLHGGEVTAESEGLGRGSVFRVRLPVALPVAEEVAAPPPAPQSAEPMPSPAPGAAGSLVLVEDNDDVRTGLSEVLAESGYVVHAAADGLEGLDAILLRKPDVAVVDIGLPGIDGYEVARRVRRAVGSAVFLVALTGYGQAADRALATQAGFDAHLTKPIGRDVLDATLARR